MKQICVKLGLWGLITAGLASSTGVVAAEPQGERTSEKSRTPAKDTQRDVEPGRVFTFDQREPYQQMVSQAIRDAQSRLDNLRQQLAAAPGDQKATLQGRANALSSDLAALQQEHANLSTVNSQDTWNVAKARVDQALARVQSQH